MHRPVRFSTPTVWRRTLHPRVITSCRALSTCDSPSAVSPPSRYEEESEPIWLNPTDLRERATVTLAFSELAEGREVLVNYNVDEPDERGFWFDAIVTGKQARGRRRR